MADCEVVFRDNLLYFHGVSGTIRQSAFSVVSSLPLTSNEHGALDKAFEINRRFFKVTPKPFQIIVCHSPEEWRCESRYYYFEFARGLVLRDGTVVVKSRSFAKKSLSSWQKIIAHEINHTCWAQRRARGRDIWSPIWLLEGLACFVAKNDVIISRKQLIRLLQNPGNIPTLPFRYRASLFSGPADVKFLYSLWYYFVEWILKQNRNGIEALLKQLPRLITKSHFDMAIERIWKTPLSKLFLDFLASLEESVCE